MTQYQTQVSPLGHLVLQVLAFSKSWRSVSLIIVCIFAHCVLVFFCFFFLLGIRMVHMMHMLAGIRNRRSGFTYCNVTGTCCFYEITTSTQPTCIIFMFTMNWSDRYVSLFLKNSILVRRVQAAVKHSLTQTNDYELDKHSKQSFSDTLFEYLLASSQRVNIIIC